MRAVAGPLRTARALFPARPQRGASTMRGVDARSSNDASAAAVAQDTFRALFETRRFLPISLVCGMMLFVQARLSGDPLALPIGVLMCASFFAIAPLSWRLLLPDHGPRASSRFFGHMAIYGIVGFATVGVVGWVLPHALAMRPTLLTMPSTLLVCCSLFWVGGWGLGRDIGLEASLVRERRRAVQLAREAEHAQLLAMRAHLDPHFLFNTLNAIAEWCRQDGAVAERAILELSGILRAVLAGVKSPSWSLASELALVRDLFALHQLRDPELFALEWDVPSPLPDISVPPMILLPLAENAIKHGPAAGHRGVVECAVSVTAERLRIVVTNPGPYQGPREGSDGLPTVLRRLSLAYGVDARLQIAADPSEMRTRAELDVPRGMHPLPDGARSA